MTVVVMGVSGSGKSTVGRLLAERLGVPFLDADDFHPAANVAKMARGVPLDDEDRLPWLRRLAEELAARRDSGAVLACSALKHSYRDLLKGGDPAALFVWLDGSRETILGRMKARSGHYMRPEMLDSQFAALEAPADAFRAPIDLSPAEIVERIVVFAGMP